MGIESSLHTLHDRSFLSHSPPRETSRTCEPGTHGAQTYGERTPDRSSYLLMSQSPSSHDEERTQVEDFRKPAESQVTSAASNSYGLPFPELVQYKNAAGLRHLVPAKDNEVPNSIANDASSETGCFGLRSIVSPDLPQDGSSDSRRQLPPCVSAPAPPPYARAVSLFSSMFADLTRPRSHVSVNSQPSKTMEKRSDTKVWIRNGVSLVNDTHNSAISHQGGANSCPAIGRLDQLAPRPNLNSQSDPTSPAPPPLCHRPLVMDSGQDHDRSRASKDSRRNRSRLQTQHDVGHTKDASLLRVRGDTRRCSDEIFDLQGHLSKAQSRTESQRFVAPTCPNREFPSTFDDPHPNSIEATRQTAVAFDEFDSDLSSDSAGRSPVLSYFTLLPDVRSPVPTRSQMGASQGAASIDTRTRTPSHLLPSLPQTSPCYPPFSASQSASASPAAPLYAASSIVNGEARAPRRCFAIKDSRSPSFESTPDSSSNDVNTIVDLGQGGAMPLKQHTSAGPYFTENVPDRSYDVQSNGIGGSSRRFSQETNYDSCSTRVTDEIVNQCLNSVSERANVAISALEQQKRPSSASTANGHTFRASTSLQSKVTAASPEERNGLMSFVRSPCKSVTNVLGRFKLKRRPNWSNIQHTTHQAAKFEDAKQSKGPPAHVGTSWHPRTPAAGHGALSHVGRNNDLGVVRRAYASSYSPAAPRRVSHMSLAAPQVQAVVTMHESGRCVQQRCVTRRVAALFVSLMTTSGPTPSFPDVLPFENGEKNAKKYTPSLSEMLASDGGAGQRRTHMRESVDIPTDFNTLFYHPPCYRFEEDEHPTVLEVERTVRRLLTVLQLCESSLIGAVILIERLVGLTSENVQTSIECTQRMSLACRGNGCAHRRESDEFRFHKNNWRTILYLAVLTTQKIWDDVSWTTANFAKVVSWFTFAHSRRMEAAFLNLLHWNVSLSASQYRSCMERMTGDGDGDCDCHLV